MSRFGALFFGLILLLASGLRAAALEVRETKWGFDGRVVPGQMNLVSIALSNPGNGLFDGVLILRASGGVGAGSGAPYVQPIFLSPHAERWVQFTIFIDTGFEGFTLEWGDRAGDRYELLQPALGPPARVLLSDAADPFASSARLKAFPDALFPATVAATDGLDGVVLDYVPRWEPARREAFLDWLRRGGTLILLPGANGQYPQFAEQLAALNLSSDLAHLGAGTVLRVNTPRREATDELFATHGFPAPALKQGSPAVVYGLEATLFPKLAQLTRPDIRWWLINSLTLLYVVVVGPLHYRWARRLDYRVSIGAFVGCIGIFATLFSIVGRRGYDEAQTVHSLSIARALEPGRHDVTQWISAFATRGDIYALTHRAPANLYAAVSTEAIRGKILNGKDGQFLADIPQYSSRQFVHRAAMPGDDTSVTVERWPAGQETLEALTLKVGAGFPREVVEIRARHRDRFYLLERKGDLLTLAARDRAQTYAAFLPQANVQQAAASSDAFVSTEEVTVHAAERLCAMLPLLYVRALDGREYFNHGLDRGPQPADRLQLFIFAKSPEGFHMQGKGFGSETGYVLYVQEIFQP